MAVSVRDVAAAASVSVGTVSNVLNRPDKVAPATVERVHAAIAELGFVRNDAARQLRAGRSRSIALVVLDVRNPFFTDIARGAEDRAAEDGMTILLGNSDENTDREGSYVDLFEEQRVHGLLISPLSDDLPRLERLRQRGTPVVLVDREAADRSFSSVAVDDVVGGELAVRHLADTGRRRVAFVGGPSSIRQVADRLEGARRAVAARRGCRSRSSRPSRSRCSRDVLRVRRSGSGGRRSSRRDLRRERPPRDGRAAGAHDAGTSACPRTSRSSVTTTSTSPRPRWCRSSSIRQPAALIGYTAVDLLLKEAAPGEGFERQQVVFQPELVVRASTRP